MSRGNAGSSQNKIQIRSYVYIDRMQPQYAALTGTAVRGDIPIAGMAELYLEVAPGNEIFRAVDIALKASEVKPGYQIVEREFGMMEVHSFSQEDVKEAGRTVLTHYGLDEKDRAKPEVTSLNLIDNITPYQAQMINRFRKGALFIPGESFFVMEVKPAGYVVLAVNEAEKAASIRLLDFQPVGMYGRLYITGSESQTRAARDAAVTAIEEAAKL
jgi:ethanolamine utilization microcompartment shell protein EutL